MIVDTDDRLFYRSIFNVTSDKQRQLAIEWLDNLPGKVYVRPNRYGPSLVCDFQNRADRNEFDSIINKL